MQGAIGMAGRILIFDGIAANRIVLRCKLSAACYSVEQADSHADLHRRAIEDAPDLVICDLDAAPRRALALCRALCGELSALRVPVVLIASDPAPALRIAAFAAGAWALLRKPLHDDLLLATLRQVLRQAHGVAECVQQQASVAELGFAEPPVPFGAPRRSVAIVADDPARAAAGVQRLRGRLRAVDLEPMTHDQALSRADRTRAPDTYVILSGHDRWQQGLRLVSDLHSRAGSRDAPVLMVLDSPAGVETPAGDDPAMRAAMALDLGADDVLFGDVHLSELAIRMERQTARKTFVDTLRRTLRNGIEMAARDPLTGLYNRRYAVPRLDRMLRGAQERGAPLALMALDLDRFKAVNDTHGHGAGDAVLVEVARRLAAALRPRDLIARSGGEEFWIALPDTGPADAATAAQALCRLIRANPVPLPARGGLLRVTVSIGVAVGGPAAVTPTLDSLLARADSALYAAKADGRDKVNFASHAA
jgi:two-component system cell cycle response regulator